MKNMSKKSKQPEPPSEDRILAENDLFLQGRWELFNIIQRRMALKGQTWKSDQFNTHVIRLLLAYFLNIQREIDITVGKTHIQFNAYLALDKGIWLRGEPDVGKTFLMECFEEFTQLLRSKSKTFKITNLRNLSSLVRDEKDSGMLPRFYEKRRCFDDFGYDDAVQVYGNPIRVGEDIMYNRYLKFERNKSPRYTHVTSMLPLRLYTHPEPGDEICDPAMQRRFDFLFQEVRLSGDNKSKKEL